MNCKYLKARTKKKDGIYKKYGYCAKHDRACIKDGINECRDCSDFCTKARTRKPINKVGKKREFVKPEIYKKVFERDNGRCRICGSTQNLEEHHIYYRSERKDLINDTENLITLCRIHHQEVHQNKHKWQPLLLEMIKNGK